MALNCKLSSCIKPCVLIVIAVIAFTLLGYIIAYFVLAIDVYYNHSSDLKLKLAQALNSIT